MKRRTRNSVTKEFCFQVVAKYQSKVELSKGDSYVYKIMGRNGWINEVFPKIAPKAFSWQYEKLKEIALKYKTKNSFKWGDWNAYHAARRRPFFEDICSHMSTISVSDEDILYLLRTEELVDGKTVYKVGITSNRCKKRRLAELKYSSKILFEVVFWVHTPDAKTLENILLGMGICPEVKKFRGYKETRMFSEKDLILIKDLFNGLGGVL